MKKIDCLGEICPIPLLRLKSALEDTSAGETILLVTECSCTLRSVEEFCRGRSLSVQADEAIPGVWEIFVSK